jgi:hypothetical protein
MEIKYSYRKKTSNLHQQVSSKNSKYPLAGENRTEELLELASKEPVETQIKRRKWRWIGHTLSKPDDATEKQALDWKQQGACTRRPKTTWKRMVYDKTGHHGMTWGEVKVLALNCVRWKIFTEDLCSSLE